MSPRLATRILAAATIFVAIGCSGSEFSERGAGGGSDASAGSSSGGSAGSGTGAAGGLGGSVSGSGGGAGVGGGGSAGKGGSGGIAGSGGSGGSAASGGSGGTAGSGGAGSGGFSSGGTGGTGGGAGCEPACTFGLTCCNGKCVNTANDIYNCGSCGLTCNQLNPHCLSGKCDVPVCLEVIGCIGEQICCGTVCCGGGTGKLCCDIQGPGPSTGPRCVDPVNGTCPIGCPGCQ